MDAAPVQAKTLDQKHHFLLRKLHSLSGIIPIGAFLVEHLLTNSMAYAGPERFNKAVHALHELPWLPVLEIFGIFLPLAFHALYGIKIAMSADYNTASYPYLDNRRYTLQRVTGYIAFVFLIIHLAKFRFAHLIGWGPEFMSPDLPDKFALTQTGILHWSVWGIHIPAAATIILYVVGLWAACYHFANGIWSFCISWGITVGAKAQKRVGIGAAAVGITLFVWGCLSLYSLATTEHISGNPAPTNKPAASAAAVD